MNPYLKKLAFTDALIPTIPHPALRIFIVIPCFNESSLVPVFESLAACHRPQAAVEVLAVINSSETADDSVLEVNRACLHESQAWIRELAPSDELQFHVVDFPKLPKKHAGVGLARKIGMDEALRRFDRLEREGIIVNLDADCTVSKDYLLAIEQYFEQTPFDGASIHFEHPLQEASEEVLKAIVQYELYLRYYIHMQAVIGFPWAFQTIGSAMAVRSSVYQQQGGMNKRKAGEDFYFLQKIIELGNFSNMPEATVFASPRKSDRVPFGTGKAVNDITVGSGTYPVYHPESFKQLHLVFEKVDAFYGKNNSQISNWISSLPDGIRSFLLQWGFEVKIAEINQFTTSVAAFRKRFFREFNAFHLMKYMHWMRDQHFANISIEEGLDYLFPMLGLERQNNLLQDLLAFREFDKNQAAIEAAYLNAE